MAQFFLVPSRGGHYTWRLLWALGDWQAMSCQRSFGCSRYWLPTYHILHNQVVQKVSLVKRELQTTVIRISKIDYESTCQRTGGYGWNRQNRPQRLRSDEHAIIHLATYAVVEETSLMIMEWSGVRSVIQSLASLTWGFAVFEGRNGPQTSSTWTGI